MQFEPFACEVMVPEVGVEATREMDLGPTHLSDGLEAEYAATSDLRRFAPHIQ
jgi:hypothetical protein